MTIERGASWGEPAGDVGPIPTARDDADLAAMVKRARVEGRHLVAGVERGDLLATLGLVDGGADREPYAYPMDLGLASFGPGPEGADEVAPEPFVAHAIIEGREPLGSIIGHGPAIAVSVMNAAWLGDLRLGPRAHPNDGLLDVTVGRVPFGQRREAHRRARSGSHLPHPDLTVHRARSWEIELSSSGPILLDGVVRGRVGWLTVEVIPDAFTVIA